MKKDHGEHNRKLCDKIIDIPENYNDWIVTTAFYSAIHYVDHKLFQIQPLEHGDKTLSNIDHAKRVLGYQSRHELREMLVTLHLKPISIGFSYLYKNCRTARYINYTVDDITARNARNYLSAIEKVCCE